MRLVLLAAAIVVVLAGVAVVAIVVHGRIAGRAVERARREDLPQLLRVSGNSLASLLGAVRLRAGQAGGASAAVPADQAGSGEAGGGEVSQ